MTEDSNQPPLVFYRCNIKVISAQLKYLLPDVELYFTEFHLVKETLKGYWISEDGISFMSLDKPDIWVSKTGKKRLAYPTKQEALTNLIKRRQLRLDLLNTQRNVCRAAIDESSKLLTQLNQQSL